MRNLLAAALVILTATPALAQDVYVKTKTHSDGIAIGGQSQGPRDDIFEQWFSGRKTAQSGRDVGFIVDLDANMAYMVIHADTSYVPMPLPFDIAKILPPEVASMAPMMQMSATVQPTAEQKTIGKWTCTGYDITLSVMGMPMHQRVWASTDVPAALAAASAKVMPTFMQGQMRLSEDSVKEFAKIKGFQIASELNADVMGSKMRTTTETVEIVEKVAPAGTFEPPAGYTKKATLSMQDLQRR